MSQVPVGTIMAYEHPQKDKEFWLVPDGRVLKITEFPELHAVLRDNYGSAPPGEFYLPHLGHNFLIKAVASVHFQPELGTTLLAGLLRGEWGGDAVEHKGALLFKSAMICADGTVDLRCGSKDEAMLPALQALAALWVELPLSVRRLVKRAHNE